MRTKILLGLTLIPMILSCKQSQNTEVKVINEKVVLLLHEADYLIRIDSVFCDFSNGNFTERSAEKDKDIRAKLDSAIQLAPHYKRSYIEKMMYLQQCNKYDEVLPLLCQMEKVTDEPMDADVRSLKAMLEDISGDSITAQRDFRLADSAYVVLIEKHSGDSRQIAFRLNRAINQSLMYNDFSILRKEIELSLNAKTVIRETEKYYQLKNKQEFYQLLLANYFAKHGH